MNIYKDWGMPLHWVIECDGQFWIVPASPFGWSQRSPYRVPEPYRSVRLEPMHKSCLIGLGIPLSERAA